jgi:hypothetical protein
VGSFTPAMREADGDCLRRARVWVDTPEALAKSGDLLQAMAEGAFDPAALQGTLADLCRGAAGRRTADEITLFKSVGTALEDLAAAELVFDGAGPDNAALRPARKPPMLIRLIAVLVALVAVVALYFTAALKWSYSTGERAGWVQKLSKKGWVCKTWEGELAMVSLPGTTPEKFLHDLRRRRGGERSPRPWASA